MFSVLQHQFVAWCLKPSQSAQSQTLSKGPAALQTIPLDPAQALAVDESM
jgi:hypothetical protein